MWLDFFWRWRYARIRRKMQAFEHDPIARVKALYGVYRSLKIEPRTFRQRIEQRIATKTTSVTEHVHLLSRLNNLVSIESRYSDSLFIRYHPRHIHQLDGWLIDDDHYPVDEPQAHHLICEQVSQLLDQLERVRQQKDVLYQFYNHSLSYALTDVYYVIDALIAIQLKIEPDHRIAALPLKPA